MSGFLSFTDELGYISLLYPTAAHSLMRIAIFSTLLLITPILTSAEPNQTDVEDIYDFIQKHSVPGLDKKVSSRTPYPKSEEAKVTRLANNILQLDYEGFTVWFDCEKRGAIKFRYIAQHDTGRLKRYKKFHQDPSIPKECQQKTYRGYGKGYDRGHLVPANHLDHSITGIRQTNFMTNILPQASAMNRGSWLRTEEITECYRDIDELLIIGGVIWGNNSDDDYFVKSHGVKTPDAYWKVIIRGVGQSEKAIAWIIPNSQAAKRKHLDNYLVTIDEIERITGEKIPVADYAKHEKLSHSWMIPRGCNKG